MSLLKQANCLPRVGLGGGGFKFSIPGFFWVGKCCKYFLGDFQFKQAFLGVFKTIYDSWSRCPQTSWRRTSANKVRIFCVIISISGSLLEIC